MKTLESIKKSDFELTESEMKAVTGGYEYSYEYSTTNWQNGSNSVDVRAYDMCFEL